MLKKPLAGETGEISAVEKSMYQTAMIKGLKGSKAQPSNEDWNSYMNLARLFDKYTNSPSQLGNNFQRELRLGRQWLP